MPYVMSELGFTTLRAGQWPAIKSVMMGRDTIVILPTSTGKSACFIIPALCMGWRTIVIYPLVALMRDQAVSMQRKGLAAASISSNETPAHNAAVLRDWCAGKLQFMLVAPERFSNPEWAEAVRRFPPDFVALDEGHTFSQWADTFRPGYKFAGEFIRQVSPKVVASYSATLCEHAEDELRSGLGIPDAKLVCEYIRRKNLRLATLEVDVMRDAYSWVAANCEGPTVVYASTRKRVEMYASDLQRLTSRNVHFYHGGMTPKDRKFEQDKFMTSTESIIVATNAFGMGIDKGDIRNVVHFDIPGNLVSLTQEIGRAGRDGLDSDCTIILTSEGVRTQRHFIRCGNPTGEDIRQFIHAASRMKDKNDVINARRDDIARAANLDTFAVGAVMAFCLGEGVFVYDLSAVKKSRVKFAQGTTSLTTAMAATRDALELLGVDEDGDGWLHFDIDALAEQLEREPAAVKSRLRTMSEQGVIEWVRAATSKPLRLAKRWEDIAPEALARLDAKAADANRNLDLVLEYCATPDDEKHDFLEMHVNNSR